MNRTIKTKQIDLIILKFPPKKTPGPDGFIGKCYQTFKKELLPILHKLFQK